MTVSILGISGTVNEGSNIIISGSGFGTKSPAASVKWDNFNSGVNDDQLSLVIWPVQTAFGGSTYPIYSNTVLRTNDVMSVKTVMGGSQYSCAFGYNGSGERYWYISYWRYDIGTSSPSNFKPWRIYGTGSGYTPFACYTELGESGGVWGLFGEPGEDMDAAAYHEHTHLRNQWVREEFYTDCGTRGNANASSKLWRNAVLLETINNVCALAAGYSGEVAWPRIGHYWAGTGDMISYFSECYIDNTQARVEIGDVNTWVECTHREIQYPTAWIDGEATIVVNRGSFGASDIAYLYVVDSDGNVNASGEPIQFGQTYGGSQRLVSHGYNISNFQNIRKIHPKF